MRTIYTRMEASNIIGMIEDVLIENNICVPSPEDDERDEADKIGFYGSVYSDLLDSVSAYVSDLISEVLSSAVEHIDTETLYRKMVNEEFFND